MSGHISARQTRRLTGDFMGAATIASVEGREARSPGGGGEALAIG